MSASGITIMWFLAPPKHCARLLWAQRGRVDVFGDRRGADETDGPDPRVGQDRIDRFLVAVDDIEHALGQAGLEQELAEPHRHRRIALRRLEDKGVAAGERRGEFPHRDHRREIKRGDAGDDAERLPHREQVDAGTGALGVFALEQVGNAAGELDHFEAALHVALGVGESLAVLGGEKPRQAIELLLRQFEKLHQHAGASLRIRRRPGRLRAFGHRDRVLDLGAVGECDPRLHLAGIRIEDVAEPPGCPLYLLAADEMADLPHRHSP